MRALVMIGLLLGARGVSVADSETHWPLHHRVLGQQRQLPCEETWRSGASDVTTYVMTFDRAGRLTRRESGTESKRYRSDRQGRIVQIEGEGHEAGATKVVSTIRHGAAGLASIKTRTTTRLEAIGAKPRVQESVVELTWVRKGETARVVVRIDGNRAGEDVEHYKDKRLRSIELGVGDVETAGYDAGGRLESLTVSYGGKASEITRYVYDAQGRLEREDFDAGLDGKIEQSHAYRYACK